MRVSLFVTCLVDQFWPSIGAGAVQVLENAGCEVVFDERQTCCGQPAFNSGYRHEARSLAERFIEIFEDANADAIVCPSGSCTAMVHHFHELFPDDERWRKRAELIASRTYEFSSFLVNQLGIEDTGASFRGRVTWHDACHGLRDLGLRKEPRALIRNVRGADFIEMPNADSCCGFGGTFSVKFPEISVAILDSKIDAIIDAGVRGRLSRRNSDVKTMHIAELLAARETL